MDQFRPIALCNVILKIITKLLANRLRPLLDQIIHPSQAAFIPNRAIGDNIIINYEVMHYLNRKKGKQGYMAIKIDLAKAYDRVEWGVLAIIFRQLGFQDRFIKLIHECISTFHFSILLNWSPFGYFTAERGIRQGDPMSLALFTMFSDVLSRLLARSEAAGKLHGVKVSCISPTISHFMYADDLVSYCRATEAEAHEVHLCLQTYCQWTGQAINWGKSTVHFSRNTDTQQQRRLCRILRMGECDHKGTYLENPFCKFQSKMEAFKGIRDRMHGKLASWKTKTLSMAGHLTLLKSVVLTIPAYAMQNFILSRTIHEQIDRLASRFLWGFD